MSGVNFIPIPEYVGGEQEIELSFSQTSINKRFIFQHWKNEFLSWNPQDFCNITYITLPVNLFWVPDIFFVEQVGEDKAPQMPYIKLMHNGTMAIGGPHQIISTCNLDVNKFPFDTQSCELSISLWLHSGILMKIKAAANTAQVTRRSKKLYLSTGEWNFNKIKIRSKNVAGVSEESMEYSSIFYEISMTRRPVLYVLNLLLPTTCFLILDIAISSIPGNYGDKISFKITLILGVSVLSLLLNEILPSTSNNPPIIALFFTGSFMFMITGLLEIFFLLYLKEKPQHPLPRLINQMLKYFKRDKKKTKMSHDSNLVCIPNEALGKPRDLSPMKTDNEEIRLLKKIHSEVQLIEMQVALIKSQDPAHTEKASALAAIERGIFYIHMSCIILFCVILALKWTSTI
ncbi:5-hydroxytryptamine receptor 3A [Microcaecilia unicolor]|uniref:5-hydroxytryptamine receptor 3A-like n=1 Tax=Microcaecilia unicolor TaxID=1415580 RepID=A0A6P7YCQ2_9AMPH|nr:5-hydroxytryptamine receptor 3A-like [Microcaecilia unicolor]